MCSKLKVFLLTGFFILIATAVFAEPFWYFHTGHTIKYTRAKSNGTDWTVTMTIGNVGDSVCGGKTDYYKITECNYNGDDPTCLLPKTKYLKMTETEGWQCDTDLGMEVKFLEVGKPEGYGWTYPEVIGQDDDGTRINIVSVTRFGSQITMRRWSREGGINKPAVYNTYIKGFGLVKETDQWVDDNAPWTQARHGYRGSTLYATFAGAGIYVYDYDGKGTWAKLDAGIPTKMVVSGPNLYATFTGAGIFVYDGTTWARIDKSIPLDMVSAGSNLYATFAGAGLYKWNSTTWTKIEPSIPTKMVASGKYLYATFPGGIFKYDGTTWARIDKSIPENMIQGSLTGQ